MEVRPSNESADVERVRRYHERTKHQLHRYAASLGYLDWETQPDPFRRYDGAPRLALSLPAVAEGTASTAVHDETGPYAGIFAPTTGSPKPLTEQSVADFFYYSMSLSAWKSYHGNSWALRVNPSSGNLHPTEAYLLAPAVAGLSGAPAIYHYAPFDHALEQLQALSQTLWDALIRPLAPDDVDGESSGVASWSESVMLVGLSSIPWREAWKYGERAFRYCQHDIGHAVAALRVAAAMQGWGLRLLACVNDGEAARLLGLHRSLCAPGEPEIPELLAIVAPALDLGLAGGGGNGSSLQSGVDAGVRSGVGAWRVLAGVDRFRPSEATVAAIGAGKWSGAANELSREHQAWPAIDEVIEASVRHSDSTKYSVSIEHEKYSKYNDKSGRNPAASAIGAAGGGLPYVPPALVRAWPQAPRAGVSAGTIVRQRRSAVAMDGRTTMPRGVFYAILAKLLPELCAVPWDTLPWAPRVHLLLFVHRVEGISPGLYVLARESSRLDWLEAQLGRDFVWERPEGCPEALPLFVLRAGDVRNEAEAASCHQAIAAQGVFSLGMLAELRSTLSRAGSAAYRELFWETGMIGQVLYLEAEAAGLRGTGIGCFFDDVVHELAGLHSDGELQSLYHFTIGGPVDDARLSTLPAYSHIR